MPLDIEETNRHCGSLDILRHRLALGKVTVNPRDIDDWDISIVAIARGSIKYCAVHRTIRGTEFQLVSRRLFRKGDSRHLSSSRNLDIYQAPDDCRNCFKPLITTLDVQSHDLSRKSSRCKPE